VLILFFEATDTNGLYLFINTLDPQPYSAYVDPGDIYNDSVPLETLHQGPGRFRDDIMTYLKSKNLSWIVFGFGEPYQGGDFYQDGYGYVPVYTPGGALFSDENFTPTDAGEFFRSHSLPPAPKGKITVSIQDSEGNVLSDAKWQLDGQEQVTHQADLVTGATYIVSGSQIEGYERPEGIQVQLTNQVEEKEVELIYRKGENESQSGGCNTGYGIIGLLFMGIALRKYRMR
jgi:hypothetical protein